jgi:pullulanase/glycogen debranching enzyme
MQKCRVIDPAFTWGSARKPETPWQRTIIYEMHVKGMQIQSNDRYKLTESDYALQETDSVSSANNLCCLHLLPDTP